jgi:hypothetical protein
VPKREYEIPHSVRRMLCAECQTVRKVSEVIETPDCDVALLADCNHARSVLLETRSGRISVEDVGTDICREMFPGAKSEMWPNTSRISAATVAVPVRRK